MCSKSKALNDNLNFDEQILNAAKSIANAAGVLIKAATAAQKELVAQGKVNSIDNIYNLLVLVLILYLFQFQPVQNSREEDGQWSQGLISAVGFYFASFFISCLFIFNCSRPEWWQQRVTLCAMLLMASYKAMALKTVLSHQLSKWRAQLQLYWLPVKSKPT